MSKPAKLDKFFSVSSQFARSVSLVRDATRPTAHLGYILTPTARDILHRIALALRGETTTRAWSLTGPYGSGKSAFALFCAQLLAGDQRPRTRAREILEQVDADLAEELFGDGGGLSKRSGRLCAVLVSGSRQSLTKALAEALVTALRGMIVRGRPPQIFEQLTRLAAQPNPSSAAVVALFEAANEYLARFGTNSSGLLVIIDELGKFLEYGATNPEFGDIFVLQELAEAATRSKRPFVVLSILHQAIDRYADHVSPSRRAEWSKVQGRFEDIAFEERLEQILRLLPHALCQNATGAQLKSLRKFAKTAAGKIGKLGVSVGSLDGTTLCTLLADCYPLHPVTALVLGPLFKQLAQNERSLFAFLGSAEPFGFQEFLRDCTVGETYRLDQLYDYVVASLGSALLTNHRGRVWAEVQAALDRLTDATPLELRVAKSIGVLQALGAFGGLSASRDILCLAQGDVASEKETDAALKALGERSVVVYRRHLSSYALWEGSDLDLDARMAEARRAVERDQNFAAFLSRQANVQPLIARRHYFQTGTLRYFEPCFATGKSLASEFTRSRDEADGRIVYCVPGSVDERQAMSETIAAATAEFPLIVVLPHDTFETQEACHELRCLRWIAQHSPELETDRTARKEVQARLVVAEDALRKQINGLFVPSASNRSVWYYKGHSVVIRSQRELNDLLSRACDETYSATPKWRNELINRRMLSSAAAAARRNLIEAMFDHAQEEALGIVGTPPERSMYETLLRASSLHRTQDGELGFHGPASRAEPAVKLIWKAINSFLSETEASKKTVEELFSILRKPPFGLKEGVLPVLLAATLAQHQSQVALYEEGSFVPHPSASVFERIFRSPGKFELQRFRIAGPRAGVFAQYATMLSNAGATRHEDPDLLAIVRPLVRLVKELPDYVVKTKSMGQTTQKVLRAIREARQPDRLLFIDLPMACSLPAFEATGKVDQGIIESYFETLSASLAELQRAYPQLLRDVESLLVRAFGQTGKIADLRRGIDHEARLVLNIAVEPKLKSFLLRATDAGTEDQTWLESIATLLADKPPTAWDDQDRARFEVQLAAISRTFEHFKVLAFEMEKSGYALLDGIPRMLRVSITVPNERELERVVQVPDGLESEAELAKEGLRRVLGEHQFLDNTEASVALLAQLTRQLLSERPG